ncbi:MAG: radical SAM protein [Phycisphaerae bacterium]
MIDISMLYCGYRPGSVPHRYGRRADRRVPDDQRMSRARSASDRRPVVVWNITRTCNLRCLHCYSDSGGQRYAQELTTSQARAVIDDLAAFGVPAVLFSGGEPLLRADLFELASHARAGGLHIVLSTNGTLIDATTAERIKAVGFAYVGISLDSAIPEVHDRFRGWAGAFEKTMQGLRRCVKVGQKVGLRLTLSGPTVADLGRVFELIERERINRACFYHLVPAGRGSDVVALQPAEARAAIDTILSQTRSLHERGLGVEVLTVDNHCDGPYLYLKMLGRGDPRAGEVYELLKWNGGGLYSSGVGIACIDWLGRVHPDQFWTHYSLGNVRQRPFSRIWTDPAEPLLRGLRDRKPLLKGRCRLCKFLDLCGGALRVRAELVRGDPWAADPACYLTDEEIGLSEDDIEQLKARGEYAEAPLGRQSARSLGSDRPEGR